MYRVPSEQSLEGWKRTSQALLDILDGSLAGILLVDDDGKVLFANRALGKFLSADHEDMTGRNFAEFLPEEEAQRFLRLHRQAIENPSRKFETMTFERKEEGQWIELYFRRADENGPTYVYFRDISIRAGVEKELRDHNAFLNSLIENSVDSIIAADMKGHIILFNPGAQQLLGYTEEEAIRTLHTTRLYGEGTAHEIMRKMRSNDYGGKGKCLKHRVIAYTKSGEEIPVSLSGSIIYSAEGRETASFGIFTDLRQREEMEHQLQEKQMELIQSEKMASLGKLAAGVAHEINNPLSGILIFANMVLEDLPESSHLRSDIERVINETSRCKLIVRELLDFARQEESNCDETNINTIIREEIQLIRNQAIFQNVEIVLDLAPDLPPACASPVRINQVFLNLTINAAEAMEGNGRLTVVTRHIPETGRVRVTFRDTGCGIPPEIKSRVFDPFFTTKEVGKGTGLGLSVSYRIIRDCGGTIEVESAPGEGAAFIIELLTRPCEPGQPEREMA